MTATMSAAELREQQVRAIGCWQQLGHVMYVLSDLSIADHLAEGPMSVEDLAGLTDSNAPALRRVLRCAAAAGIFAEREDGTFEATPLSAGLRSANVGGLRPIALFAMSAISRLPYSEIMHSVRTGQPAFDRVFGMSFYEYLASNRDEGKMFEEFMTHWSQRLADQFTDRIGVERFHRIADIGGGNGYFLARLLQRNKAATGVLFDLPPVLQAADGLLAEAGVADRVTTTAGDFFVDRLPHKCDAYVLKAILHNWPDDQCGDLLAKVSDAMTDRNARLIIIDQIVPPLNEWDHSKVLDMDMLVLFGGKERTLEEWRKLLDKSGFELINEPAQRGWSYLEARLRWP